MVILVTYDLNKPGKNYSGLYAALETISSDYIRPLESVWLFSTTKNAVDIYNFLGSALDSGDRILVTEIPKNHAGWLQREHVQWLASRV